MPPRRGAGSAPDTSVITAESVRAEGTTPLPRRPAHGGRGAPHAIDAGQSSTFVVRKARLPRHERRRHRRAGAGRARHLLHVLQLQGGDVHRGRRRLRRRTSSASRRRAQCRQADTERTHRTCQQGLSQGVRGEHAHDGGAGTGGDVQSTPRGRPPARAGGSGCSAAPSRSVAGRSTAWSTNASIRPTRPARSARWSTARPTCGSCSASPTIAKRQSSSSQGCTATHWGFLTTTTQQGTPAPPIQPPVGVRNAPDELDNIVNSETRLGGRCYSSDIVRLNGRKAPSRTAIITGDRAVTFGELRDSAWQVANTMLGLAEPGDRVGILAENIPEYVECYYGVPAAGMALTFLDYRSPPRSGCGSSTTPRHTC